MATWKKVIVSGSSANLANVQVDGLTQDQVVIGGGSGNLTTTAINGTGNIVATTNATNLDHSGSFSGSFQGDGSGLTGVVATVSNALVDGPGIVDFSYDGSTAGVAVSVDSASLAGNGLDTSLGAFVVKPNGTTIDVSSNGIQVVEANLSGIPNSSLTNNSIQIGTTDIALGATGSSVAGLTLTGAVVTGSFSGSFTGDVNIDLEDLTAGAGLIGAAYDGNTARTFSVDSGSLAGTGLGADPTGLIVNVDDSTIGITTDSLNVKDGGITGTQLNTSVAGDGLSGGGGSALSVNVDNSTIETNVDTLRVKAGGIGTAQIADSLGTLGSNSFTGSFSGSFTGDGAGLTGLASTLNILGDTGTDAVDLLSDTLDFEGTANEIVTAVTDNKVSISLPDDVTIGQDLTVTRDLTVARNLIVQGTASFQHETNLDVADRFIRLASGSTANGDGGIVVQQNADGTGEVFGFDNPTKRFGMSGSFDASTNAFTPDAFMAAVVEGGIGANDPTAVIAKYTKKGNMFVADNGDIHIYS